MVYQRQMYVFFSSGKWSFKTDANTKQTLLFSRKQIEEW